MACPRSTLADAKRGVMGFKVSSSVGFPLEVEERGSHLTKSLAGTFCGDESLIRMLFTDNLNESCNIFRQKRKNPIE